MADPEDIEEKIEEIVEEKVESAVDEKLGEAQEEVEESVKEDIKHDLLVDIADLEDENEVDRRSFLKMLGLGAGGLALASPVSSFIPLASSSGGGGSGTLSEVLSNGNDIGG
ncbi:MAG: twin-arginine translocation signal domain-containing protein, partial [Candidatus Nanohaloarchaea archaeon]